MHWLTENPVPLMIVLFCGAVGAAVLPNRKGQKAAVVLLLAVLAVWVAESLIVTPAEQLEADLQTLLDSFKREDLDAIARQIDEGSAELNKVSAEGLKLVKLEPTFHLKDVRVSVNPDGREATAQLRANGRVIIRQSQAESHLGTRWETVWRMVGGQWKLSVVKRLDPVSGEVIGILDAR